VGLALRADTSAVLFASDQALDRIVIASAAIDAGKVVDVFAVPRLVALVWL
jgi:hypothetical protein